MRTRAKDLCGIFCRQLLSHHFSRSTDIVDRAYWRAFEESGSADEGLVALHGLLAKNTARPPVIVAALMTLRCEKARHCGLR